MDLAHDAFVDRMGQAAESDGLSPIAGRLFALLLLADEPRSLDELAETLAVSKASISTEARRLFERRVVERVTRPGDRRDYYALAPDFFAQIIRVRADRWRRIQGLAESLRHSSPGLPAAVRDRLTSIDELQSLVIDRIDAALDEWEERRRTRAKHARKSPASGASRRRRSA